VKNIFDRQDMAEERISKIKDSSIEISKTKNKEEKRGKAKNIQEL
jgi:hypothetical protein